MNLVGYAAIAVGILWAITMIKSYLVHKALEVVDKKTEALKGQEQVFGKKIQTDEDKLKEIADAESKKSNQEAEDFWNQQ